MIQLCGILEEAELETVKIPMDAKGWGWEEINRQKHGGFVSSKMILCDTAGVHMCHYAFLNPVDCTTP